MADHALSSHAEVAEHAVTVRAELKVWEKAFASTHGGKKAGREDIKQNPDIAAKYKEYSRLKSLEASLSRRENRRQEPSDSHSKKRKHASPNGSATAYLDGTPRKSARGLFATPSNNRTANAHPSQLDPYDSPSTFRRLFSPSTHRQSLPAPSPLKPAIGPTPQRDGKALGLFDMLSESGGSTATPSAKKQKDALATGFQTPSKPKTIGTIAEVPEDEIEETSRLSRTPASSTKQFYLANLFATPTTMRYAAIVEAEDENEARKNAPQESAPPEPAEPHPSETPSFLRRSNSGRFPPPAANNDSAGLSPIASRKPRQFAGRGLSHIVQGLRAMEEEREDDDWDVLREIEAEQEAASFQVPETQHPAEGHRPYKKKGQKRTTRRVNMRPVISRPKPKQDPYAGVVDEDESDDELAAVPETQIPAASKEAELNAPGKLNAPGNNDDGDGDIASLHTISEPDLDSGVGVDADSGDDPEYDDKPKPPARAKTFSERIKEAVSMARPKAKEPAPQAAPVPEPAEKKPRARKINPEAHANYRSLKIGNRGSRGHGRFRRR
ncbi:uncharacterized protein N7459_000408 [Penicillium hispanicum]|uniref:uncharacterized protein n=1 Tax=Penicillium hispanicum TaxID=1080232 RepID=UPI00253F78CD|nr:uncharacterized protein N7459_000408 [Penicillium hispanicum]KAJ5594200.1 hypothetical protein N7459_000408 [Penicillium hispanicum]